jgi:hypothetical protein
VGRERSVREFQQQFGAGEIARRGRQHQGGLAKIIAGIDFDGADFTHAGHRVTFEVLRASFGLDGDRALGAIGAAVRFLDIGGIPVADAKGLETVLKGIKETCRGDDALLTEAMRILDAFYSAYAQAGKAGVSSP